MANIHSINRHRLAKLRRERQAKLGPAKSAATSILPAQAGRAPMRHTAKA